MNERARHGWVDPSRFGRPHTARRSPAVSLAGLPGAVLLGALPEVYDQAAVGSCTAQACAAAVEILGARAGYAPERPDRPALYHRGREAIGHVGDDSGAILADLVSALRRGWEPERAEPSSSFDATWVLPPAPLGDDAPRLVSAEALSLLGPEDIAYELAGGSPVAVGLRITGQWDEVWGHGELDEPTGNVIGGHAVLLVGYDLHRRAWRVRNSWSTAWGDGGYAWLPWGWTRLPWCGEAWSLRAVRRAT